MDRDDLEALMRMWDETDSATQAMLMALPSQMTQAAIDLNTARLNMRSVVQRVAKNAMRVPGQSVRTEE